MSRYFDELKRRNVFRVGAAYAVVGWLAIEVVDTLAPRMAMPEWVPGFVILLVIIGFPIALLFSWAFEMTPEGLKKTADVDTDESIAATTGQKVNYFIIAALVAVVLFQQVTPSLSRLTSINDGARPGEDIAIAVLPFADLSAAGDQEYLGDGVAEEILNVLAGVEGLRVTSRTSAFAFKEQNVPIPDLARALGVSHIVEGSIRKQDDQVRITAQLIEVADDSHLWSDTYDSDLSNIFRLQDEIAGNIASALSTRLNLALPTEERAARNWDIAAYELYLRARALVVARVEYEEAIALLDTAIRIEPEFADAWAEKAAALALAAFSESQLGSTDKGLAMFDEAWLAASRANEISPGNPLGEAVQGLVRFIQFRFIEARVLLERSLRHKKPDDNAVLWFGILQDMTGDTDAALSSLEAGLESSPTAPNLIRWRDSILASQGNWERIWAERNSSPGMVMDQTRVTQLIAGVRLGEISIDEMMARIEAKIPEITAERRKLIAELIAPLTEQTPESLVSADDFATWGEDAVLVDLGVLVNLLGPDQLDRYVRRSMKASSTSLNLNQLNDFWWPELSDFRKRPETKQYFVDVGLPEYWDLYGWPPMCARTSISDFECN
jgi:TolB-like protein